MLAMIRKDRGVGAEVGTMMEARDINNPKIPIKFVKQVGKLVYKTDASVTEIADDAAEARSKTMK